MRANYPQRLTRLGYVNDKTTVMEIKFKRLETEPDTNCFIEAIKNATIQSPDYKSIDYLFNSALKLQEKQNNLGYKHFIEKPFEFLLKEIIKAQQINPELTLYSINKYILLFSRTECQAVIDSLINEYSLREHLCKLTEEICDVDLDWYKINNFVESNKLKQNEKFLNALKFETLVVLNAIKYNASPVKAHNLINEIINCLESQEDLKLWYTLMKKENLEIILDLCVNHNKLLITLFNCFDKFAEEIETNYDEELKVKYSHVNLDFEDFFEVFQSFCNFKDLSDVMNEFLAKRIDFENKHFNFWLDVKACLLL